MKIILLGFGNVGKTIYSICSSSKYDTQIKSIVSPRNKMASHKFLSDIKLDSSDTIIDFSAPEVVLKNTEFAASKGVNIVMGTTGWEHNISKIKEIVNRHNIGFAYTPNYMLSMHALWDTINFLSTRLSLDKESKFRAYVFEKRLFSKKHNFSSTAKKISSNLSNQKNIIYDDKTSFLSILSGYTPMEIRVELESEKDNFSLNYFMLKEENILKSYAKAAIKTAKWLKNKKGFYELDTKLLSHIQEYLI